MRIPILGYLAFAFCAAPLLAQTNGLDSFQVSATHVSCFGLRDGTIHIDTVYGSDKPFFYSVDGHSFTTNPTFDRMRAGVYTLEVRSATGLIRKATIEVREPNELLVRILASDSSVVSGMPFSLKALTNLEPEFLSGISWQPAGLFNRQDTIWQWLSISESTLFSVEISNKNGCRARHELWVEVSPAKLYFPNVIQPGEGENAYFTAFSGDGIREIADLRVFDRNGNQLFERAHFQPNAPALGWGGKVEGRTVPSGVYTWMATVLFADGSRQIYTGAVTVLQ